MRSLPEPAPVPRTPAPEVSEALELLIAQFSQPLAFLRELVQNALDAGTNAVDVAVRYDDAEGCAVAEVADTGEGMDRAIIDGQLTRLFSSAKEGDLTKIGKFGIGFVSVFAIGPKAVVVDTARAGEGWRVLFHPDRTFDRIVLDEPLEGTRVRVYVAMPKAKFGKFRSDCRSTVRYWCKHCEVEIRFDGAALNEPFALQAPFQVRHEVPGTEVVVAPSPDDSPFFGFYNRGLTLMEGAGSPLPGVSFKVRSRYLEHTLTRDNVMRDENYDKAMAVVQDVAYRLLPLQLFEALDREPGPELWRAAALVLAYPKLPSELHARKVFRLHDGSRASVKELATACSGGDADLAAAATAQGERVLQDDPPMLQALRAAGTDPQPLADVWYLPVQVPTPSELEPLLTHLTPLLDALGLKEARLARIPAPAMRVHAFGRAQRRDDREGRLLALDPEGSLLTQCAGLAAHDPGLAACLLLQGIALELGEDPGPDALFATLQRRRSAPPPAVPTRKERR